MIQLILHAIGDYLMQSDWMAQNKTKNSFAALCHALTYSIPFIFILPEARPRSAWIIIFASHFLIDRFRLARYVVFAKNFIGPRASWPTWSDCKATGYHSATPPFMAIWLMIIGDNTIHLAINYACLRWL